MNYLRNIEKYIDKALVGEKDGGQFEQILDALLTREKNYEGSAQGAVFQFESYLNGKFTRWDDVDHLHLYKECVNYAHLLRKLHHYPDALAWYEKSATGLKEFNANGSQAIVKQMLATIYGGMATCYEKINEKGKATSHRTKMKRCLST